MARSESESSGVRTSHTRPAIERTSQHMRDVNEHLRWLADTLAHADPLLVFCECTAPACHVPLQCDRVDFDAVVAAGVHWQVAPGHLPSGSTRAPDVPVDTELPLVAAIVATGALSARLHGLGLRRPLPSVAVAASAEVVGS